VFGVEAKVLLFEIYAGFNKQSGADKKVRRVRADQRGEAFRPADQLRAAAWQGHLKLFSRST